MVPGAPISRTRGVGSAGLDTELGGVNHTQGIVIGTAPIDTLPRVSWQSVPVPGRVDKPSCEGGLTKAPQFLPPPYPYLALQHRPPFSESMLQSPDVR
jgi:hypothetical protein